MNLAELYTLTVATVWSGTKGERTAVRNGGDAVSTLGPDLHPADVTYGRLVDLVQLLRERGNGPATINRKLSAVSAILRNGAAMGMFETVPQIPWQKEPEGRVRWLSEEEARAAMSWADAVDARHAPLFRVLLDTGLRLSEALNLRWEDCQNDRVTVTTSKSGRPRTVPLTAAAARCLYSGDLNRPGPFASLTESTAGKAWRKVRTAAGLGSDVVIHTLRHTCASRLVQRGVSLPVVQAWLGHSNIRTTMRYVHLATDALDAARDALEDTP